MATPDQDKFAQLVFSQLYDALSPADKAVVDIAVKKYGTPQEKTITYVGTHAYEVAPDGSRTPRPDLDVPTTTTNVTVTPGTGAATVTEDELVAAGATKISPGVYELKLADGRIVPYQATGVRGGKTLFDPGTPRASAAANRITPSRTISGALGLTPSATTIGTPQALGATAIMAPTGTLGGTPFSPTNPLAYPITQEQAQAALEAYYNSPASNREIQQGLPIAAIRQGDQTLPITLGGYVASGGLTPLNLNAGPGGLGGPTPQFVGTQGLGMDTRAALQAQGLRPTGNYAADTVTALNALRAMQRGAYPAPSEDVAGTPYLNLPSLEANAGKVRYNIGPAGRDYYGNPTPGSFGVSGTTSNMALQDLILSMHQQNPNIKSLADIQKQQIAAAQGGTISDLQAAQIDYEQALRQAQADQGTDYYAASGLDTVTTKPTNIQTSEFGQPERVVVQPIEDFPQILPSPATGIDPYEGNPQSPGRIAATRTPENPDYTPYLDYMRRQMATANISTDNGFAPTGPESLPPANFTLATPGLAYRYDPGLNRYVFLRWNPSETFTSAGQVMRRGWTEVAPPQPFAVSSRVAPSSSGFTPVDRLRDLARELGKPERVGRLERQVALPVGV